MIDRIAGWSALHKRAFEERLRVEILHEPSLFWATSDYNRGDGKDPLVIEKKRHRFF